MVISLNGSWVVWYCSGFFIVKWERQCSSVSVSPFEVSFTPMVVWVICFVLCPSPLTMLCGMADTLINRGQPYIHKNIILSKIIQKKRSKADENTNSHQCLESPIPPTGKSLSTVINSHTKYMTYQTNYLLPITYNIVSENGSLNVETESWKFRSMQHISTCTF